MQCLTLRNLSLVTNWMVLHTSGLRWAAVQWAYIAAQQPIGNTCSFISSQCSCTPPLWAGIARPGRVTLSACWHSPTTNYDGRITELLVDTLAITVLSNWNQALYCQLSMVEKDEQDRWTIIHVPHDHFDYTTVCRVKLLHPLLEGLYLNYAKPNFCTRYMQGGAIWHHQQFAVRSFRCRTSHIYNRMMGALNYLPLEAIANKKK